MQSFNGLTAAEAERLAMLAEEAGEVVQAVGKVLRHGYASTHPNGGPTNREVLVKEIIDFAAVYAMMVVADDLVEVSDEAITSAVKKKQRYTHHQKMFEGVS